MNLAHISSLILQYRYWILIPLSVLEGPIVAFIAGTLASLGYFSMYFLIALFLVRDVGMDCLYYALGYFGAASSWINRLLRRMQITEEQLAQVRHMWEKHPFRTMLIGKISYGIAATFIVVAGAVHMRFAVFIKNGLLVSLLQYGTLLLLGYFFGNALGGTLTGIINNVQYLLGGIGLVVSTYYIGAWYLRSRMRQRMRTSAAAKPLSAH